MITIWPTPGNSHPFADHWLLARVARVHRYLCGRRGHSLLVHLQPGVTDVLVCAECGTQATIDLDPELADPIVCPCAAYPWAEGMRPPRLPKQPLLPPLQAKDHLR